MKELRLPKGSIDIIKALENRGGLTQIQLIDTLNDKKPRAIRYTIRTLLEKGLIIKRPNFEDMRSSIIYINDKMQDFIFKLLRINEINYT